MKTRNLFIVLFITIFAGCSESRHIEASDDDGGSAESVEASEDDSGSDESEPEDIAILGTWQGTELGVSSGVLWIFEFGESEAIVSTSGIEAYKGRYFINTNFVPHHVNFHIDSSSVSSLVGKTALAIYEIDGNLMKLAAMAPGELVRPTEFEPSSDGMIRVFELEKQ